MKIVYMGTPEFAVLPLEKLAACGYEILAVVTQPDKQKGRGKVTSMSAVKEWAIAHGIEVFQPIKVRSQENVNQLRQYNADLFVVAAFGQILSKEILSIPKYGCINIHASLLPKYRGAAPIQWSIIDGEKQTGVTIMQMDEGIDTGDMLDQVVVEMDSTETAQTLHDKLSVAGADLIIKVLSNLENGGIQPIKQNNEQSCYAKMLDKTMGNIDWNQSSHSIECLVRGLNPWPSAYSYLDGKQIKIWEAKAIPEIELTSGLLATTVETEKKAGCVLQVMKDKLIIQCGEGVLEVTKIQTPGKKMMSVREYLAGNKLEQNTVFKQEA